MEMKVPAAKPFFKDDIRDIMKDAEQVLKTRRLILGPFTERFEREFADYIGVKHAVAVNSCTTAMIICMRYFDVSNREVVVPTNTFISSPNSVLFAGGSPVLVDMNPDTLCINVDSMQENITDKTRGVMIVHIAGLPVPETNAIRDICHDKNIFLIEDCAHAAGAAIDSKKVGSLADAGCFSFYPTKVMTTMTGGMITTDDDSIAGFARKLRHFGSVKGLTNVVDIGSDWVMNEISAVLGHYQLRRLDEYLERRNEIAGIYTKHVAGMENIKAFPVLSNIRHSYYKYATLLSRELNPEGIMERLKEKHGIETGGIYNPACHMQPLYRRMFGFEEGHFPIADDVLRRVLCPPMHADLSSEEIDYVVGCLKEELNDNSNHSSG